MNTDDGKFRIFISHNVNNHSEIANSLQTYLHLLSKEAIECQICTQTPGGTEWRKWVETEVSRCNLFLYIYTSDYVRQDWLLFEAGVYLGARHQFNSKDDENDSARSDLICLKSPGIPTPPEQIGHLNAYEADKKNLQRFFVDLLVKGEFSDNNCMNEKLLTDYAESLETAIQKITDAFARNSIESQQYRKRLEIGPIDPNVFDQISRADELEIPLSTPVDIQELAREIIGFPEGGNQTWDKLKQFDNEENVWISEISEAVRTVYEERAPRQVLTPFNSTSYRACYPIISRIDKVQNKTHKLSVLLMEHERIEEPDELADELKRAPNRFKSMIQILNLIRRTRWNAIEPFKEQINTPGNLRHDISVIACEFCDSLDRLERESHEAGLLNRDKVKRAFNKIVHDEIDRLFDDYETWREKYTRLCTNPDEEQLISLVEQLSKINKRYWLLSLDRYEELVDQLPPLPIKSTRAASREMLDAEVWEKVIGSWKGLARDIEIPGLLEFEKRYDYDVQVTLKRNARGIRGTLKLTVTNPEVQDPISIEMQLEGVFASGSYFAIIYRITDAPGTQQFGVMLIKLVDTQDKIRGLFLSKKAFEEGKLGFGQIVMVHENANFNAAFTRTPEWMRSNSSQNAPPRKKAVKSRKKSAKKAAIKKKTAVKKRRKPKSN